MKQIKFDIVFWLLLFIIFLIAPILRIWIVFISWTYVVAKSYKYIKSRFILLAFSITFFTFLLGRIILPLFFSTPPNSHENMDYFSANIWNFTYLALFLSLSGLYLGYSIGEQKWSTLLSPLHYGNNSRYYYYVRKFAKRLVYVSFVFKLMVTIEIIKFVFSNGYLALYLTPPHSMPYIVYKLADLFVLGTYVFLATMPCKKDSKFVLFLYIFDACVSIFTGRRGTFMFAVLLVYIYIYIRDVYSTNEKWLTPQIKRLGILAIPFVLVGMFFIGFLRAEVEIDSYTSSNPILSFFYSQGGSVQLIGLTKQSIDRLPPDQWYLLGPLLHIFDGTTIGQLFGRVEIEPQSPAMAMHGDSLGDYLTYQYNSVRYLNGGGYGSCYIAEAYADLGYFGIFLINYLFGWLMSRIRTWLFSNVWYSTFSFYVLFGILHAPRGQAFSFLKEMLTPTVILVMILIHLYAREKSKFIQIRKE